MDEPPSCTSLTIYQAWVTALRSHWSERLTWARRIDGNGCSSSQTFTLDGEGEAWPTPDAQVLRRTNQGGAEGRVGPERPTLATELWATPNGRDWKDGACEDADVPTNPLLGRQAPRSGIGGPRSSRDGQTLPRWPTAQTNYKGHDAESYERQRSRKAAEGIHLQEDLRIVAMRQLWATPLARAKTLEGCSNLKDQLPSHLRLNPIFVTWLMGFPLEWCRVPTPSRPSATRSSRSKRPSRGGS